MSELQRSHVRVLAATAACLMLGSPGVLQGQSPAPDAAAAEVSEPAQAPVAIPSWLVSRLDRVVEDGIRDGITPGVSLVVGFGGQVALVRNWGRLDWGDDAPPVTDSTVFDLASVTKAVATTTAAMRLVEDGRLDLDAPVSSYLADWPSSGAKGRITVRHLLNHTSGLPAAARLWRSNRGREAYLEAIAGLGLQAAPGREQVYSDLGMIVLQLAMESVAGEPLDAMTRRWVIDPLQLSETAFRPLEQGMARTRVAPTELNPKTGKKTQGWVHGANAHALGGIAGHAGLFGSARDLARFAGAAMWREPQPLACEATMERFTGRDDPASRFGLGWEKPVPEVIWSDFFSDSAYGHTGFTGTSLWLDPEQDFYVVLLTSRLNSDRGEDAIHDLRRWVHRAVHGWIVDPMSAPAIARAAAAAQATDAPSLSGPAPTCSALAASP